MYSYYDSFFLGYANEVGEAFRSIIGSKWVAVSYGIATTYVIADTVDKTKTMHNVSCNQGDYLWLKSRFFTDGRLHKKDCFCCC